METHYLIRDSENRHSLIKSEVPLNAQVLAIFSDEHQIIVLNQLLNEFNQKHYALRKVAEMRKKQRLFFLTPKTDKFNRNLLFSESKTLEKSVDNEIAQIEKSFGKFNPDDTELNLF